MHVGLIEDMTVFENDIFSSLLMNCFDCYRKTKCLKVTWLSKDHVGV